MSKIGKMPIALNEGTNVTIEGQNVKVVGLKGELSHVMPKGITASVVDNNLLVKQQRENDRTMSAFYGLTRALLANMVKGVESGFEKKLELQGVGYRAQMQGQELVLSLGYSHPVKFPQRPGVNVVVAENIITVSGMDKMLVGELASEIRAAKPPEPYKGKGIRYVGEHVRRKAGKAAKAVGGK